MFGFFRRAHAEALTKHKVEQMVSTMRVRWGQIPTHVWHDEYVMAWMRIGIIGLLKMHSNGRLTGEALGLSAARVWQYATGQDQLLFLRAGADTGKAAPGSDAARAYDDASLWLAFLSRRPNLKVPRAQSVFEAAQRQDREALAIFGEASDTMASACAILFTADIVARVGEVMKGGQMTSQCDQIKREAERILLDAQQFGFSSEGPENLVRIWFAANSALGEAAKVRGQDRVEGEWLGVLNTLTVDELDQLWSRLVDLAERFNKQGADGFFYGTLLIKSLVDIQCLRLKAPEEEVRSVQFIEADIQQFLTSLSRHTKAAGIS